jgi:hypothetical protein
VDVVALQGVCILEGASFTTGPPSSMHEDTTTTSRVTSDTITAPLVHYHAADWLAPSSLLHNEDGVLQSTVSSVLHNRPKYKSVDFLQQ